MLEDLNTEQGDINKFLKKFTIPADKKQTIRKELHNIGIHEGYLFPELEHQFEYMKEEWKRNKK